MLEEGVRGIWRDIAENGNGNDAERLSGQLMRGGSQSARISDGEGGRNREKRINHDLKYYVSVLLEEASFAPEDGARWYDFGRVGEGCHC